MADNYIGIEDLLARFPALRHLFIYSRLFREWNWSYFTASYCILVVHYFRSPLRISLGLWMLVWSNHFTTCTINNSLKDSYIYSGRPQGDYFITNTTLMDSGSAFHQPLQQFRWPHLQWRYFGHSRSSEGKPSSWLTLEEVVRPSVVTRFRVHYDELFQTRKS